MEPSPTKTPRSPVCVPMETTNAHVPNTEISRSCSTEGDSVSRPPSSKKETARKTIQRKLRCSHGSTDQEGQATSSTPFDEFSFSTSRDNGEQSVKITIQVSATQRKRSSRYLCESDRREIIKRIDDGEQQAALAEESKVSRPVICNLYKNRWQVLSREVSDPKAKHPKKSRTKKTSPHQVSTAVDDTPSDVAPTTDCRGTSEILNNTRDTAMKTSNLNSPTHSGHNSSGDECLSWTGAQNDISNQDNREPQRAERTQPLCTRRSHTLEDLAVSRPFHVHETSAHSYSCRNLIAALRDASTSSTVFRQRAARLAQILVEDEVACLPHNYAVVKNQYGDICRVVKTLDEHDIFGVSMEGRGSVLLRAFSDISPASPAGIVSIDTQHHNELLPRVKAHLPPVGPEQVVLLLDIQCATGLEACAVLNDLIHHKHIADRRIYYVTLISSLEGLERVSRSFPGVTLITAHVDSVLDQHQRIRPVIGDFVDRLP